MLEVEKYKYGVSKMQSGGKQQYLNEAIQFAKSYRNSPGFKERWNKINNSKVTRRSGSKYDDHYGEGKVIWRRSNWNTSKKVTPWNNSSNAAYFPENGFFIGTNKEPVSAMSNWKDELTHEVGHYFESNITPTYKDKYTGQTSPYGGYFSDIYPIFRNSKSYKETLDLLSDDEERQSYEKSPSFNYYLNYQGGYLDGVSESLHDGTPTESYADLFLLRKKLLDSGVYDIRKANNPFTKQHLEQFKKKNKDKIRLFDNFSDEDIIWMMNNVAQNNSKLDKSAYYAKSGIKIKKSNRGKFTSYCGGEVTSACIQKGKNSSDPAVRKRATFAANARKWKHQIGGKIVEASDNTRVARPFNQPPIKVTRQLPQQAQFSALSEDEMNRRKTAAIQRKREEQLYHNQHLWNIDPTKQVTRNNVGFAFANAGIQGEPIRQGLALYSGVKGIQSIGKAATNFVKSIPGRAQTEAQMLKESFTTPVGRQMWGQAAGRFIHPLKWTTGTGGAIGNLAYWNTKGKMFQPVSGVLENAILKSQGVPTDEGLTEQEEQVSNDSLDTWVKGYDLNAKYTFE